MPRRSSHYPSAATEVAIYIGYLASFMVLLAASLYVFSWNPLYLVFELFIVAVLAGVVFVARIMG